MRQLSANSQSGTRKLSFMQGLIKSKRQVLALAFMLSAHERIHDLLAAQMADCRTVTLEQNYRSSKLIIKERAYRLVLKSSNIDGSERLLTCYSLCER
eukprot:3501968-Pleurochrysis_carterae.AAC.1